MGGLYRVSMRSAALYRADEREPPPSAKAPVNQAEQGKPRFLLSHTIKFQDGGGRKGNNRAGAAVALVGKSQLVFVFPPPQGHTGHPHV